MCMFDFVKEISSSHPSLIRLHFNVSSRLFSLLSAPSPTRRGVKTQELKRFIKALTPSPVGEGLRVRALKIFTWLSPTITPFYEPELTVLYPPSKEKKSTQIYSKHPNMHWQMLLQYLY
jgi:hypothetical protein